MSYPAIRKYITEKLAETIREHFPDTQAIAGVATAGIPQGALIADMLGLPFAYVRPEPKKHGMKNSIEGRLDEGARVAVVEDLISTGKSSLKAVDVLKESGFHVAGLVSIFNYGFPETHKRFQDAGCAYVSLCDFNTLAEEAENSGKISKEQLKKIEEWSSDPAGWSSKGDGQFWV